MQAAAEITNNIFSNLNAEQLEAVSTTEGPLLVLAGAGTGKTKVLTTRIANILCSNLAFPSQILAVTFTNKAARGMSDRVNKIMADAGITLNGSLWLGTFHSTFLRILRKYPELVGLKDNFTILNDDDQLRILKALIADNNIDEKRYPAKMLAAMIDRLKDQGISPDRTEQIGQYEYGGGKLLQLYQSYQTRLRTLNAVDFGDLLLLPIQLFTKHPEVLAEYQRKFKYILVDEYQDTNIAQYLLLRLLAQEHKNICCVGDDDQSIYSWRGAEVGNILKFEKDFPGAKVIRLERNYRSTKPILAAASKIISFNKSRLGKTLWTEEPEGNKLKVVSFWDEKAEAQYTGKEIETLRDFFKASMKEVAVLVRAGYQTRAFEEAFLNLSLPYKVVGGLRFYERMEIRDAIAYLRLLTSPVDDLAFERIINTPKRGIGASTIEKIAEFSKLNNVSMFSAIPLMLDHNMLPAKAAGALQKFVADFAKWKQVLDAGTPHHELAEIILKESGYIDMWKVEKTIEAEGRVENLHEFIAALEEFETLEQFLEHVSLVSDTDNISDQNMVNIMTLHSAKGLEFETVFLPGWEEGLFPSQRSIDEKGLSGLEEERRLAYVGITRARKNLYISFASRRRIFNQWQDCIPSRFVDELPKDQIEVINSGINFRPPNMFPQQYQKSSFNQQPRTFSAPKQPSIPTSSSSAHPTLKLNERVFHDKFGYGWIKVISGSQITVNFEKAGLKTLIDTFLKKLP